ncbi:18.1 kDa class I heat shock protein-like [Lycium barbarum]|uniref:18.1 kDa class I heat shock protein-like n=1 Tax=Lycium barbarum TaxID=112863 RepID=UPI00293F68F2|nr:18.1 kDa class I heat shock protein-like [Lycium barbarum]
MSLMPLFNGRKSYARRQNPPHQPTTTITHQSQKNQAGQGRYDSPTKVTHQFQTNRGEHDLYYPPTTIFNGQSQTNQDRQNLYDPTIKITHQSQPSRGQQDPYYPSHEFYLENPRSLIAPALSFPHEPPSLAPIEYKATPEAHVFKVNLHGYKKEEVKVEVEDESVLKITGEKKIVQKGYDNWHHFQRRIGKFSTTFNLPVDARADKVKSTMENGVLIITVPKM